jgi:hypothetical protein
VPFEVRILTPVVWLPLFEALRVDFDSTGRDRREEDVEFGVADISSICPHHARRCS